MSAWLIFQREWKGTIPSAFFKKCYPNGSLSFQRARARLRSTELTECTRTPTHPNHTRWYFVFSAILTGKPSFKGHVKQNPLCLEVRVWNSMLITVLRRHKKGRHFQPLEQSSTRKAPKLSWSIQHYLESPTRARSTRLNLRRTPINTSQSWMARQLADL